VGLVLAMGLGGAVISRTSAQLVRTVAADGPDAAQVPVLGRRLLTAVALEVTIVGLVIVDMVVKPG